MPKKLLHKLNTFVCFVDRLPLWWIGLILMGIVLLPFLALGEGSVFVVHDQLDESMMNYVLTARHAGESVIPEMLGGINADGLQPAAVLFVPLYRMLPPFYAFLSMYFIIFACAFMGMYLAVRELTGSSILAVVSAGIFCMLPFYPIYGLSQMGIPLVLYAFLCLSRKKHVIPALILTVFFGLTSHLVCTGYAVLAFWAVWLARTAVCQRRINRGKGGDGSEKSSVPRGICWPATGFAALLFTYLAVNRSLFVSMFLAKNSYVSHREEMVNNGEAFWGSAWQLFVDGHYHAPDCHTWLILPILVLLLFDAVLYRKLSEAGKKRFLLALGGMAVLIGIALFYGLCRSKPVADWKNSISGFMRYFQMERFHWLYPAGWYLELALVFGVWWPEEKHRIFQCLLIAVIVFPVARKVLYDSYFYMNVNQYNNGSAITGCISWESWYAEDLMQEIDDAIGMDRSTYRVAHLGINPAPALMHGFYTADGYSNNYPLEYKHAFRKVIAAELDKNMENAVYFDKWGSRCYLLNSQTGNYYMMPKGNTIRYEGLEFDLDALAELGCGYLFSGAEITDAEDMGLKFMGYYDTPTSYWGVWLYEILSFS